MENTYSIMSDCKTVSVCVLQRYALDDNDHINILSPTFSQNSVFKIKYCILFIASDYIYITTRLFFLTFYALLPRLNRFNIYIVNRTYWV